MTSQQWIAMGLMVGGAAYLSMAWYVFRRRRVVGAYGLLGILIAIFIWTSAYAVELTTHRVNIASIWSTVKYLGIVGIAPAFALFMVEYTSRGQRQLTRRALGLLSIEPLVVMVLLAVPVWHPLVLTYSAADQAGGDMSHRPVALAGPLFWPHAIYNYVVLTTVLGMFVWRLLPWALKNRAMGVTVLVSTLLPLLGNIMYNALPDVVTIDPTPFLFIVLTVVLVWGLFRLGLFDLMPVARSAVVEQMSDPVLVLDPHDRVLDINPAGTQLLGRPQRQLLGMSIQQLLPSLVPVVQEHSARIVIHDDVVIPAGELAPAAAISHLSAQVGPLHDKRGLHVGRLLVLRDVTARAATERQLRELLDAETHLAAVLQTSLRPATLPEVPGVQIAARSLPAYEGGYVSGDFYDVHPVRGGDWSFVVGDVAGKGVNAAVVTSLARYTVRTLGARGYSPCTVIEQLNRALLEDVETDRFCTVVYGRLSYPHAAVPDTFAELGGSTPSLSLPDSTGGVRVTLALGGHPPPLLRRRDGHVQAVGRPGTALGIVPRVSVEEVTVDVAPGEVLVAYTDGVTEARRHGQEFGDQRLADTIAHAATGLLGRTGQAAAGLVADAVADHLMQAVVDFAMQRDDVAIMVIAAS